MVPEDSSFIFPPSPFSRLWRVAAWVLLVVCAVLPGLGALDGPFFIFDDLAYTRQNPFVTGSLTLWDAFRAPYLSHYAPLHQVLSYAQWHLCPDSPLVFRLVSLALHLGAAFACWRVLHELTGRKGLALGVTLLWAAHPAHAEAVAWIVEQKTLGCGLFSFLALAVYLSPQRPLAWRLAWALALLVVALLFKTHAVFVAPVLALYELLLAQDPRPWPRRLMRTIPFFAVALVFSVIALLSLEQGATPTSWGLRDCLENLPATLLLYLEVALLPWKASFFHDMERVLSFSSPAFTGNLLLLAVLGVGGFFCVAKPARRLFSFCVLGWIAAIGPMLNVNVWSFPAYDRFEYMALPLLLLAVALVAEKAILPSAASILDFGFWILDWLRRVLSGNRASSPRHPLTERDELSPLHPDDQLPIQNPKSKIQNRRQAWLAAVLWVAALVPVALLGAQRGALFFSELAVMLDAAAKAPRAAFAYLGISQCLKFAWQEAAAAQEPQEQRRLALAAYEAMNRARDCPDYKDFYHNDINLLVDVGQMLVRSGLYDEAQVLLNCVATERRWAAFPEKVEWARKLLAEIEAQRKVLPRR